MNPCCAKTKEDLLKDEIEFLKSLDTNAMLNDEAVKIENRLSQLNQPKEQGVKK